MPALPIVDNVIRVAIRQALGDDLDVLNLFHYRVDAAGPYGALELNAVAQGIFKNFTANLYTHLSNELVAYQATAKDLSALDGGEVTYVPSTGSVIGGVASPSLPANCALVLSWHEFISYRGGHPRTYLAGIGESMRVDPQHVGGSTYTDLAAAASVFLHDVNANTAWDTPEPGHMAVVHYSRARVALDPPETAQILSVSVNNRIDSQRRRLGR